MNQEDPFWTTDIEILFRKDRLIEFVPTPDMTLVEKLNALSRFLLYAGVLMVAIYKNSSFLYIPVIGLVILHMIYQHYPRDQEGGDNRIVTADVPVSFKKPSRNNPFMNVLMSDYTGNPLTRPADDVEKYEVKEDISKHFNHNLYKNVNDIWDKGNSQRQFYTNPSTTIPNDRNAFMKWCWNTPYTCKDGNQARCLRYEDPRASGKII